MISADFNWAELEEQSDGDRAYLPSHQEIAAMCADIRRTWSERESRRRSADFPKHWTVPTVSAAIDMKLLTQ